MRCIDRSKGTSKAYLIDSTYKKEDGTYSYTVKKIIDSEDPTTLFLDSGRFSTSTIDGQYTNASGENVTYYVALYAENGTSACPDGAEVKVLAAESVGWKAPVLGTSQSTGICVSQNAYKITGLNLVDTEIDYQTGGGRLVAYAEGLGENPEAIVLNYTPGKPLSLLARLTNPELFPQGCGRYLMAIRLLPNTTKLAFAYRTPSLLTVDYTDASQKTTTLYDGETGGTSTCEGYTPSYQSLRTEFKVNQNWNETTNAITYELFLFTRDRDFRPMLLSYPL